MKIKTKKNPAKANRIRKTASQNTAAANYTLLAALLFQAAPAAAQTASDQSAIYSGIAFSVACLVVLILVGVLFRRFGKRNKAQLADDSGLDIMSLKQKQLLTPEEMKMVSAAIARRMAEKENKKTRTTNLTPETLLHDPEIQRLREEAAARRAQGHAPKNQTPEPQNPAWNAMPAPTQPPTGAVPPEFMAASQPDASVNSTTQQTPTPTSTPLPFAAAQGPDLESAVNPGDPIPADFIGKSGADEIQLPPEVQKLAEAGLLTPQELENIKRRLRDR